MLRNKKGYLLLYFLSFCISTGIFHAVAHAQESALANERAQLAQPKAGPTPTIFVKRQVYYAPTPTATVTPTATPEDNPVMIAAKTTKEEEKPTEVPPTEAPTPTATPTPVPATATPADTASGLSEEALTYLGNCETGMNPSKNSGNGYYGAFQFSEGTWRSLNTGYDRADQAPLDAQKAAVRQLLQRSSIHTQFPGCANKMKSVGLI